MHQLNNFNLLLYSTELLKLERNSLTVHINSEWHADLKKKNSSF